MINKIFNWTAGSFFRTLGRFVFYGLVTAVIVFLFSIFNAKAAVYSANDFEIKVNNKLVMGDDGGGLWDGGYATISSGNEVNMNINVNNIGNKAGDNLLVTVTFCSTGTYYGSILTPGYDLTNATLINNYSIQRSNTACRVGGYDGVVMQSIWNLSVPGNSFLLHSWGGVRDNYTVLVDVTGITISDFDPAMAQEFLQYQQNQTIIDQNNQLINGFNNLQNQQQQTNDKLDETNEQLGEMNDYIQDDTPASTEDVDLDSLGTVSGLLPAGPVDSLLNIPFTFLSVLTSSMSGTCVPITGTFVFDSTLSIPCFDSFYDEVPDYLMNFINLIPAGFILILYFKHLYKKVDRAVSLQSTADDEWGVI